MSLSSYFTPENILAVAICFSPYNKLSSLLEQGKVLHIQKLHGSYVLRLARGLNLGYLMQYSDPVPREPEFNNFNSYYLTWYDSSNSSDGPYGEPLQYAKEGLSEGFNSFYEEARDGFLSGYWYSENRETDQVYDTMKLPNNGDTNWVDEYASYFASCWGEDMVPSGYCNREYEDYNASLEKAEDTSEGGNQEGSNFSFTDDMEGAQSVNPWAGYHFDFLDEVEDNYSNHPPAKSNEDSGSYMVMGLWESIFGYWRCLQRVDEESPPGFLLKWSH